MSVKKYTFTDLVRIEQLRNIETSKTSNLSYASIADMDSHATTDFKYTAFLQRLAIRARRLIQDNALANTLLQPQKLFTRASRISLASAAILGALAAGNAVGESATLNIYWLLAVLLGFNLLSILLWLTGIIFNLQGLSTGVAAQLASWLPYRHKENDTVSSLAARAWWESCLTGTVGKWRISVLTHKFWLTYIIAGVALLILLMLAKQYNFIWGTTLLPESSLPELTRILGKPMEYMGLSTPDSHQIAASRMGTDDQDAETRSAWARFLLGTLLFYGLMPRLVLLAISILMQKWAERNFKLDLYLPYYIELRQRLMTREIKAQIIDADPQAVAKQTNTVPQAIHNTLPLNAYAFGIELDDQIIWPETVICRDNIIDQQSLAKATHSIRKIDGPLLVGVAIHRLPDRGVQRIVRELIASTTETPWLILLHRQTAPPVVTARKLAWFRLAEACGISAEHIIIQ
ncbi:Protein of unknown function [Nitrosomonas cryotolerans]|uniref:DUF2868 domain-containing protein n=1 Tax=Nitrosomonas cryotolerans ATCC 49181 TaxID=1131553 RepID=A0A1N6G5Y8_9PROT|nr:DUF2868 domain-containing protein [Nitrosomonas cryotolerans]SFP52026.1 Protein of unknown function [Nitrosomonas cryotolerans]SIO02938.1 Protein of unknown function [Nitrosomonas cryotolerans ATCC 49181]